MLKVIMLGSAMVLTSIAVSAQTSENADKSMPPIKMLPKKGESKQIIKLNYTGAYEYFDNKGVLQGKGEGQWLDVTNVSSPIIFVKQNGKTEKYVISIEEKKN